MMIVKKWLILVAALAWMGLGACSETNTPQLSADIIDGSSLAPDTDTIATDTTTTGNDIETTVDVTDTFGTSTDTSTDIGIPDQDSTTDIHEADSGDSPIQILSVTPMIGTELGGDIVTIIGEGFTTDCKVWFGDMAGQLPYVEGETTILVLAPAHPPGFVDITVERGDGFSAVVKNGYYYETNVKITKVSPDFGPAIGGTPVIVEGNGFDSQTVLLFGGKPAISMSVTNSSQIVAITPGGLPGYIDVQASTPTAFAHLSHGFRYQAPPTLEKLSPWSGTAAGGEPVDIFGTALWEDTVVRIAGKECLVVEPGNGTTLRIVTPGGPIGPADVEIETSDGSLLAEGVFTYLGPQTDLQAVNIWPKTGPLSGGTTVYLTAHLPAETTLENTAVLFGNVSAIVQQVLPTEHLVIVTTPEGKTPEVVNVDLIVSGQTSSLPKTFTYTPDLTISAISPTSGPQQGGTSFILQGKGFHSGTTFVRIGALPASNVVVTSPTVLSGVTPAGTIGPVDVTVTTDFASVTAPDAFVYTGPSGLNLFALDPMKGSMAGGTYVEIYGTGFSPDSQVWFGDTAAVAVEFVSAVQLAAISPGGPVSTVDIVVVSDGLAASLTNAYTYFNPTNSKGGTWGEPIDGAINVTVLDAATTLPIEAAVVILGAGAGAWVDTTDEYGLTTFSGPGLTGPASVSASATGYSTYTVSDFDSENVTVLLNPDLPPGPPGGGSAEPATVRGKVIGMDKYVIVPPTDCDTVAGAGQIPGLCVSCSTDADCTAPGSICGTLLQPDGVLEPRCTLACADNNDCPEDYVCGAPGADSVCHPTPPQKAAYCVISKANIFAVQALPGPANYADDQDIYQIPSRNGEVAVICYGGFLDAKQNFVPTVMGVLRHVFPIPGGILDGQDVELTVPLNYTLRARLVEPPIHPLGTKVPSFRINLRLDGEDGYIQMPELPQSTTSEPYLFGPYPSSLTGPLFGATYTFYTTIFTNNPFSNPYSVNLLQYIESIEGDSILTLTDKTPKWQPPQGSISRDLADVWAADATTAYAVGPSGGLVYSNGVGWFPQGTPVKTDLRAIWGSAKNDVWAVGESSTILRFDGIAWSLFPSPVSGNFTDVWGRASDDVYIVGDVGILHYDGINLTQLDLAHTDNLVAISGDGDNHIVATGMDGKVVSYTNAGWVASFVAENTPLHAVWVHGPGYAAMIAGKNTLIQKTATGWVSTEIPTTQQIRTIWGRTPQDMWVAGDAGTLLHWNGTEWQNESDSATSVDIHALVGTSNPADPLFAVGKYNFLIGPFMPFPEIVTPSPGTPFPGGWMKWTLHPYLVPNYTFVSLADSLGKPFWQIVVNGSEPGVNLPDFGVLSGLVNWPAGMIRVAITHTLSQDDTQFNINSYNNLNFNIYRRLSWSIFQTEFL
ncbi:MAG: IPT/TIG domain-containing protein [Myxococcales bacterium]|nr:IPT/TIG domain-containing protein [Myxococcales bacterium]